MKRYERDGTEEKVLRLMDWGLPPSRIDRRLNMPKGTAVDIMCELWRHELEGSLRR